MFRIFGILTLVNCSVGGLLAGPKSPPFLIAQPPEEERPGGHWRVSAGAVYRDLGDVRFNTGSRSQDQVIGSLFGKSFRHGSRAGGATGLDERFYEDGFVRIDSSGSSDGLTWYWGYDNASQVAGDAVIFRNSGARSRMVSSVEDHEPSAWGDDFEAGGPLLQIDYAIPVAPEVTVAIGVSGSFVDWDGGASSSTFYARQSMVEVQSTISDSFGLGGATAPIPPYEGTFEGPGILLDAIPASRSVSRREVARSRVEFFNRIDESLDVDLYTISPGLSVEVERGKVFATVGAGVALNIADWDADHREVLYASRDGGRPREVRSWADSNGGTDLLWGAYVQAGLGVQVSERLSLQGFVRYDWSEDLEGSVGPSRFSVELDGVSGGLLIGWTF